VVDVGGNERSDRKVLDKDIRIYRGGSFADVGVNLRSAYRDAARPTSRLPALGFRLVRTYRTP
jgi:formylglycine-generating enzyme required for sulfatase activity